MGAMPTAFVLGTPQCSTGLHENGAAKGQVQGNILILSASDFAQLLFAPFFFLPLMEPLASKMISASVRALWVGVRAGDRASLCAQGQALRNGSKQELSILLRLVSHAGTLSATS